MHVDIVDQEPDISHSAAENDINEVNDYDEFEGMPDQEVCGDSLASSGTNHKWKMAKFLLHVAEEQSLTHHGVDDLIDSVQWLVDIVSSEISERIQELLSDDIETEDKKQILDACKPGDIFNGLNSRFLREKYYDNHFNYVVSKTYVHACFIIMYIYLYYQEPKPVLMGTEWNWVIQKGQRKLSETKQYGYVIDLFSGLKVQKLNHIIHNVIMYLCIIDVTK